jgi:hypothetical protein
VVKQRLDDYFADLQAGRRVSCGRVDPGWHAVTRAVDGAFQPTFELVRDPAITEVSAEWFRDLLWKPLESWYRTAGRNGLDGRPRGAPESLARAETPVLALQRRIIEDPAGAGTTVVALVEIRLGPGGRTRSRLVASSGHPLFDEAAVQAVAAALRDPEELKLPETPGRALVAMSAVYTILPPLPVAGFAFDEMLGYFEWMYPLKKLVSSRVELVALYQE